MTDNIYKVWGERRRLLLTDQTEIDLLYLKQNSFCSTHKHKNKINKFVVIEGSLIIETEFGKKLILAKESFTVNSPLIHRFFAREESIVVELAYVKEGKIDPEDIERFSQGGRVIDGLELTEDEMREKGLLGL
jgi:mannose-6-phosphate isomerase-like protein (cupin superfamily)